MKIDSSRDIFMLEKLLKYIYTKKNDAIPYGNQTNTFIQNNTKKKQTVELIDKLKTCMHLT